MIWLSRVKEMIQHFQYQPLYKNSQIPGWILTFYYKNKKWKAHYHQSGQIEWLNARPSDEDEQQLKEMIHELMLYHVYDS